MNKFSKKIIAKTLNSIIDNELCILEEELSVLIMDRDRFSRDSDIVKYDNKTMDIEKLDSLVLDIKKLINNYRNSENIGG